MTMVSGTDSTRRSTDGELRGQIVEDRRRLRDTVTALHDKTDIKGRVRYKAFGALVAVAAVMGRVGRTAGSVPRFVRWAQTAALTLARSRRSHD